MASNPNDDPSASQRSRQHGIALTPRDQERSRHDEAGQRICRHESGELRTGRGDLDNATDGIETVEDFECAMRQWEADMATKGRAPPNVWWLMAMLNQALQGWRLERERRHRGSYGP